MNKQSVNVVMDTPAGEPSQTQVKPKKVLTEAQRLAFLKGREKRVANIERKRQEKIEADGEAMAPPPPKKKRTTATKNPEPVTETETQQEVEPLMESELPDTDPEPESPDEEVFEGKDDDYHEIAAQKIADYLFAKIRSQDDVPEVPSLSEAKPKRKYERKAKVKSGSPEEKKASASMLHNPVPIPQQRMFSWA